MNKQVKTINMLLYNYSCLEIKHINRELDVSFIVINFVFYFIYNLIRSNYNTSTLLLLLFSLSYNLRVIYR